jgi:hypothetical protein
MRHFEAAERALIELLAPFTAADITSERLQAVSTRNLAIDSVGGRVEPRATIASTLARSPGSIACCPVSQREIVDWATPNSSAAWACFTR